MFLELLSGRKVDGDRATLFLRVEDLRVMRSSRKRLRHPAVGWLELDCEALHDPDRGQWVILYTAPPGSPAAGALRLLRVVGLQNMTAGR